ncbi:hypothetical protein [Streptomyces sp. WMMC940]|uniref:hypothetical protein n=1 Tax=Streptomyces sp. WMMC940 TaxID=3015153 RepID=UPI0022B678D9|nr:hypothetical protein [Streptomyces sp. WMMC940]MCZ7460428.1 hypothetical protein [Streptomyces sp. WMMC940]
MGNNKERLDAVLRRRREHLPVVDEQIDRWRQVGRLVMELGAATAAVRSAGQESPAHAVLDSLDTAAMGRAAQDCLDVLATVRSRVSRSTVNIGVSGRARNGKSTLLQSLSGLDDRQIPSGRGQPVTAVRSRIYHSATDRGARLTMHTETSFIQDVIAPYHTELGIQPTPCNLPEFASFGYPRPADGVGGPDQPRLAPILARVREAQEALDSYRQNLTGEVRTVDLSDIREWVAYPESGPVPVKRPYLAVRDAAITCPFPIEDVTALGLVDMPGLGELVPEAEAHHLDGLRNDVDFVIVVKRPTDTNSMWAEEDARALQLIGSVCTVADVRDFTLVLVNTGDCLPENIKALEADLRERLNGPDTDRGYWVVLADGADSDAVRDEVLQPVLEHLATALPRMDEAVIEDAVAVCRERRDRIVAELAAWSATLRAVAVPTSTELTIARAEELREEVAASLQGWVDTLRVRAEDDYEDTEFSERVGEVHRSVRAWVLSGFGEGAEAWRERALKRFRVDRASLPFASAELNRVRVEMARRFSAVDDLLMRRQDEYWAGLVAALGPRLALVVDGTADCAAPGRPQDFLPALARALREAPDPCPVLAETLDFALDVRLDYRTRVLPRLRRALGVLHPETDDPSRENGPTTLLAVPRTEEGAELLLERVTQLARQAAYDAQAVLAQEPETAAQALFAYGEQFEDAFVRSESSQAEFRRLVDGFQDRMWPGDGAGPQAAPAQVRRLRSLVVELRNLIIDTDPRAVPAGGSGR